MSKPTQQEINQLVEQAAFYIQQMETWLPRLDEYQALELEYSDYKEHGGAVKKSRKKKYKAAKDARKNAEYQYKYAAKQLKKIQRKLSGTSGSALIDALLGHPADVIEAFGGGDGAGDDVAEIVDVFVGDGGGDDDGGEGDDGGGFLEDAKDWLYDTLGIETDDEGKVNVGSTVELSTPVIVGGVGLGALILYLATKK